MLQYNLQLLDNKNSLSLFAFKIENSIRVGTVSIPFASVFPVLNTELNQRDSIMFVVCLN